MVRIDFVRNGNTVTLEPNPARVRFQDVVRFFNLDDREDHQVFGERLPRLENDDPAASSEFVVTQDFDYACELHGQEGGSVQLSAALEFTAVATPVSRERIAARAYELYLARGCTNGHDRDDWLAAERELSGRGPSRPPSRAPRRNVPSSNR